MAQDVVIPTVDAYENYCTIYDEETREFWKNFPNSTLEIFVGSLSGKRVLNIGSRPGRDVLLLKDKGLDVFCLDASSKMVEMTK